MFRKGIHIKSGVALRRVVLQQVVERHSSVLQDDASHCLGLLLKPARSLGSTGCLPGTSVLKNPQTSLCIARPTC